MPGDDPGVSVLVCLALQSIIELVYRLGDWPRDRRKTYQSIPPEPSTPNDYTVRKDYSAQIQTGVHMSNKEKLAILDESVNNWNKWRRGRRRIGYDSRRFAGHYGPVIFSWERNHILQSTGAPLINL